MGNTIPHPDSLDESQSSALEAGLELMENWLKEECDLVRSLTQEVLAVQKVIGWRFLQESETILQQDRWLYQQMLVKLLDLNLDTTGISKLLTELDELIVTYQQLTDQIKAQHANAKSHRGGI